MAQAMKEYLKAVKSVTMKISSFILISKPCALLFCADCRQLHLLFGTVLKGLRDVTRVQHIFRFCNHCNTLIILHIIQSTRAALLCLSFHSFPAAVNSKVEILLHSQFNKSWVDMRLSQTRELPKSKSRKGETENDFKVGWEGETALLCVHYAMFCDPKMDMDFQKWGELSFSM